MQPRTAKLLEDMRDAAAFIGDSTRHATQDEYTQNRMLRQSVERNFEIIGEAMRRLSHHDAATARSISGHGRSSPFGIC